MIDLFKTQHRFFTATRNYLSSILALMTLIQDKKNLYKIVQGVPAVMNLYCAPLSKMQKLFSQIGDEQVQKNNQLLFNYWFQGQGVVAVQPLKQLTTPKLNLQRAMCKYLIEMYTQFIKGDIKKVLGLKKIALSFFQKCLNNVRLAKTEQYTQDIGTFELTAYLLWISTIFLTSIFPQDKNPVIITMYLYFQACSLYYFKVQKQKAILKNIQIPLMPNTHVIGFFQQSKIQLKKIKIRNHMGVEQINIQQPHTRNQQVLFMQLLIESMRFDYDRKLQNVDSQYLKERYQKQMVLIPAQIADVKLNSLQKQIQTISTNNQLDKIVFQIVGRNRQNKPPQIIMREFIEQAKMKLTIQDSRELNTLRQLDQHASNQQNLVALFDDQYNLKLNHPQADRPNEITRQSIESFPTVHIVPVNRVQVQKFIQFAKGQTIEQISKHLIDLFLNTKADQNYLQQLKKDFKENDQLKDDYGPSKIQQLQIFALLTRLRKWFLKIVGIIQYNLASDQQNAKLNKQDNNIQTPYLGMTAIDAERIVQSVRQIFVDYFSFSLQIKGSYLSKSTKDFTSKQDIKYRQEQNSIFQKIDQLEYDPAKQQIMKMIKQIDGFPQQNDSQELYVQNSIVSDQISSYHNDSADFQMPVQNQGAHELKESLARIQKMAQTEKKQVAKKLHQKLSVSSFERYTIFFSKVAKDLQQMIDTLINQERNNPGIFKLHQAEKVASFIAQIRKIASNIHMSTATVDLALLKSKIEQLSNKQKQDENIFAKADQMHSLHFKNQLLQIQNQLQDESQDQIIDQQL